MSARTARRAPILLVVAGLLAGAIALDRSESSPVKASRVAGASTTAGAVSVPAADALSTSWYCAEGTSNAGGRADETVVVGNLSDARLDATITVMPGGAEVPVSQRVQVEARGVARVRVARSRASSSRSSADKPSSSTRSPRTATSPSVRARATRRPTGTWRPAPP